MSSSDVVNDEGRLLAASSADTSILNLREIIRLTEAAVIIEVEVMVEETTAVKVEAVKVEAFEICLIKQQRLATSLLFVR